MHATKINSGLRLLSTAKLIERRDQYAALGFLVYVQEADEELARRASRMLGR